jgi:hypothetical protein
MDDTKETIIVAVIYVVMILGFKLAQEYYVRRLYKKYNMGGRNNKNSMSWKKASKAFGIRVAKLRKMNKVEIKKVYRMRAKKAHPDHGGSDEKFNNLNEAYKFAYAA